MLTRIVRALARLTGSTDPALLRGLRLEDEELGWTLDGSTHAEAFLHSLPRLLVGEPACLMLESGSPRGELARWIETHRIEPPEAIAHDTIWPRSVAVHLPVDAPVLASLAELCAHVADPELAIHVKLYRPGCMLLEWHDAFADPIRAHRCLGEEGVRAFAAELGFSVEAAVEFET